MGLSVVESDGGAVDPLMYRLQRSKYMSSCILSNFLNVLFGCSASFQQQQQSGRLDQVQSSLTSAGLELHSSRDSRCHSHRHSWIHALAYKLRLFIWNLLSQIFCNDSAPWIMFSGNISSSQGRVIFLDSAEVVGVSLGIQWGTVTLETWVCLLNYELLSETAFSLHGYTFASNTYRICPLIFTCNWAANFQVTLNTDLRLTQLKGVQALISEESAVAHCSVADLTLFNEFGCLWLNSKFS